MPKKSQLDVIREQVTYKEEEDEEDGSGQKEKDRRAREDGSAPSFRENKTVMSISGPRHGGTGKRARKGNSQVVSGD